jgi:hypothetical protein
MRGQHFDTVRLVDPNVGALLSNVLLHAFTGIEEIVKPRGTVVFGLDEEGLIKSAGALE